MIRVAIVSDTHGELDRRVAARAAQCDRVVHAGDLGSSRVAELLRAGGAAAVIVRGNNDTPGKWMAQEQAFLHDLPECARLELPGGFIQIVHGDRAGPASRRHEWLRRRYPQARAVVYGHSHRLSVDTTRRPWVLNPGAAGVARTFGGPSMLVLSVGDNGWRVRALRFEPPAIRSFS